MLILETSIVETPYDLDVFGSVVVGFQADKSLVIRMEMKHDCCPDLDYRKETTIRPDDAYELSRRFKVGLVELPDFFSRQFGRDLGCSAPSEVGVVFKEMVNYIARYGGRPITKTYE